MRLSVLLYFVLCSVKNSQHIEWTLIDCLFGIVWYSIYYMFVYLSHSCLSLDAHNFIRSALMMKREIEHCIAYNLMNLFLFIFDIKAISRTEANNNSFANFNFYSICCRGCLHCHDGTAFTFYPSLSLHNTDTRKRDTDQTKWKCVEISLCCFCAHHSHFIGSSMSNIGWHINRL